MAEQKIITKPQVKAVSFEDFLVEKNFITKEQLSKARSDSVTAHRNLFDYLVTEKYLSEEDLTKARGLFFNLPYADLRSKTIAKDTLLVFSKQPLVNYRFIPFELTKKILKVGLVDPTDIAALEALEFLSQKNKFSIELYIISYTSFSTAVRTTESLTKVVTEALQEVAQKEKEDEKKKYEKKEEEQVEKIQEEAPISKIVDVIIKHAIDGRASDIHIEPSEEDLRVRYRIDGVLHSSLILPKTVHSAVVSRIKILSNLKIDEQRLPQDGRFHINWESRPVDFRVSTFPTVVGEKVVLRILDKSTGAPTLDELGMWGRTLEIVKDAMSKPHGMFLITGPTGSGKSTTLYAILSILNKPGVNIVTLEDPVEYFIDGVNQAQIRPEIGLTFASGLRSILRQDPNIIMVGEIRDQETAELAVHSALTGHLVFSTLHTNSATGALPRLVDMGIEPYLLTASLNAVGAQRLVRQICSKCKAPVEPSEVALKYINDELPNIPKMYLEGVDTKKIKVYAGRGCPACGNTGFKGRMAIYEIVPLTKTIQGMITDHLPAVKIQEYAIEKEGMLLMKQDGVIKALKGITTVEEVMRATKD
jgi:type IV pilus assembly protein PilB